MQNLEILKNQYLINHLLKNERTFKETSNKSIKKYLMVCFVI